MNLRFSSLLLLLLILRAVVLYLQVFAIPVIPPSTKLGFGMKKVYVSYFLWFQSHGIRIPTLFKKT